MASTLPAPLFKYKPLGNTGVKVSELCFGAMTISESGKGGVNVPAADEKESFAMLDYFAEKGGNFIDTADFYGSSESVLGRWLSTKNRDDFIIATKVGLGFQINKRGLSRRHILESVEKSLKNLQTSYIDLYQAHAWDPETPIEDTLRTFNDLVRSGKVRYIGVSNFTGVQLQSTIDVAKQMGLERVVCLQPQYSLLCRSTEWDLIPVCQKYGIGVIPWSPLAGGWLSGKYTKEKASVGEGSRLEWAEKAGFNSFTHNGLGTREKTLDILDTIAAIAKENGQTDAQVALRWVVQKPGVTAPIMGAKNLEQLKANLNCLAKELSEEQMKKLDDISATSPPYPWVFA